jgi:hypothetical protein
VTPFTIPFSAAAEHIPGLLSGQVVRYGAILKDATTGQILGHVQETGVAQKILQAGLSFDPTGATGLIGVAQNVAISTKLNAMQQALGGLQVLQYASLFSSVVGVGVTAASTAMILKRLTSVDEALSRIEDSLESLPARWRELSLRSRLLDVSTSIERLHEASFRSDASKVVSQVEKDLQKGFNHIHDGLCSVVIEAKVDPGLLRALLAGLSLCGASEFKALVWLDEKDAAQHRSRVQFEKLQQLAFLMPKSQLAMRLVDGEGLSSAISEESSEIRHRVATQPALIQSLIDLGINGRAYVEQIQQEEKEPLLLLPSPTQS